MAKKKQKKAPKEYTNVPQLGEPVKNQLDKSGTFMIVNVEDKWRIGMSGRWMTMEKFNSPEEAEAYIASRPWDLIMNLAGFIAEYVINKINK